MYLFCTLKKLNSKNYRIKVSETVCSLVLTTEPLLAVCELHTTYDSRWPVEVRFEKVRGILRHTGVDGDP